MVDLTKRDLEIIGEIEQSRKVYPKREYSEHLLAKMESSVPDKIEDNNG